MKQCYTLNNEVDKVSLGPFFFLKMAQLDLETEISYKKQRLKITWKGAFYENERVKINSSSVILVFSLYVYCC